MFLLNRSIIFESSWTTLSPVPGIQIYVAHFFPCII
jgi:hypothetical protein